MATLLITGGARGIGRELVKQALEAGHDVIASVRAGAESTLDDLKASAGDRLAVLTLDVSDPDSIRAAAAAFERPVDILINNAGIIGPLPQSTLEMDFDGFAQTFDVNTLGPLRVIHAFLKNVRRGDNPRVVTISSKMGSMAFQSSDRIAYRASKAAVNKVMQGLATDLREDGVTVVSMHPGWVRTDMGGGNADLAVEESAAGILAVVTGLSPDRSGSFINYDGTDLPW
ncbi:MAG: SDR family oxidoreductase [Pseudomonadota bacterium]